MRLPVLAESANKSGSVRVFLNGTFSSTREATDLSRLAILIQLLGRKGCSELSLLGAWFRFLPLHIPGAKCVSSSVSGFYYGQLSQCSKS